MLYFSQTQQLIVLEDKPLGDILVSQPCISPQQRYETPGEAVCPQYTGSFREKWACELSPSPLDTRLYISMREDRSGSELRLRFVFLFFFLLSALSVMWKTRRTEALFMSLLNLLCSSVSLYLSVPGADLNRPLYCLVAFLNSAFINSPCHPLPLFVERSTVCRMLHRPGDYSH